MKFRKGIDYQKISGWLSFGAKGKYQTLRRYAIQTDFRPDADLVGRLGQVHLRTDGTLLVTKRYVWDGASGPTWDTTSTMRASLVHDALYQLMREQNLDATASRLPADRLLRNIMIEDGAWEWRADLWLWAVRRFARRAAVA